MYRSMYSKRSLIPGVWIAITTLALFVVVGLVFGGTIIALFSKQKCWTFETPPGSEKKKMRLFE